MYLNVHRRPSIVLNGGGLSPMQIKALKHVPLDDDGRFKLSLYGVVGYWIVPLFSTMTAGAAAYNHVWKVVITLAIFLLVSVTATFILRTPLRKDKLFAGIESHIPDNVKTYPMVGDGVLSRLRNACGPTPWAQYYNEMPGHTDLGNALVARLVQYIRDIEELRLFQGKVTGGDETVLNEWLGELTRYAAEDLRNLRRGYRDQDDKLIHIKAQLTAAEVANVNDDELCQDMNALSVARNQIFRDTFLVLE